jgi:hypothetical protein
MPRRPRSVSAATARLSIRVTDREGAALADLARRAGVSGADFVRSLIERERSAHDYVDGRVGSKAAGHFSHASSPRSVFTLHRVPGRAEPLCVRRRVLACGDTVDFEIGGGREVYVYADDLLAAGTATTSGLSRCIDTAPGEWRKLDGRTFYDLDPRIDVYLRCPTAEERSAWVAARRREQELLARALRDGHVLLWRMTICDELGAPAKRAGECYAFRPTVEAEYIEYRGDLFLGAPPRSGEDRRDRANLFKIARAGYAWARGYSFCGGDGEVAYTSVEPTAELLATVGASAHAAAVRFQRVNRRTYEAAAKARAVGVPSDVLAALVDLGLSWPCTVADVTKVWRRRATTEHPDLVGDDLAMRRTNRAAELVRDHLARRAS